MIPIRNIVGHFKTICKHKWWVFFYSCKIGIPVRGFFHDMSKFSPVEFWESARYYAGGTSSPINVAKNIKGYSLAWQHHKGRNPHHYEYWTDKYDFGTVAVSMPFKYVVEMIADYFGAGRAYNGKAFTIQGEKDWWEYKLKKFPPKIHPATKEFVSLVIADFSKAGEVFHINNGLYKKIYEDLLADYSDYKTYL